MMKKLLIPVLCTMLLTGCGESTGSADAETQQQNIAPNIMRCSDSDVYFYAVDKNTGVVYLQYRSSFADSAVGGITVMLNTDGTPVTAQQLGIEY